jgi:hypothetical protein
LFGLIIAKQNDYIRSCRDELFTEHVQGQHATRVLRSIFRRAVHGHVGMDASAR